MDEEEIRKGMEILQNAANDNHKISEHCFYFDEHQMGKLKYLAYKLENELKQEKEKNKKLEEVAHNLAQAIRFMSTNENLTIEGIIKEFTENQITEEFMQRWEKSRHEESHLKDKVIDMMAEDIVHDRSLEVMETTCKSHEECYQEGEGIKSCEECAKEYYFNKVKKKANDK